MPIEKAEQTILIPPLGLQGSLGLTPSAEGIGHFRSRQREQSTEPPQPLCRRCSRPGRPRHASVRSSDGRGGARPRQCLRHPAAGGQAPGRGPLGASAPATRSLPVGYFGASTGAAAALQAAAADRRDRRHCVARRQARSRRAGPRSRAGPYSFDCRRKRSRGACSQPRSAGGAALREQARDRSGRQPLVRGTGNA